MMIDFLCVAAVILFLFVFGFYCLGFLFFLVYRILGGKNSLKKYMEDL